MAKVKEAEAILEKDKQRLSVGERLEPKIDDRWHGDHRS
jgi:hypothetical protein